jgi:hypothetical protein
VSRSSTVAHSDSASTTAGASSTHGSDRDNDQDHNNDDENVLGYGHAANAADRRASVALVTRYFAAAAGGNGATACSLLMPFIAGSVVENYSHLRGLRGNTCAVVLSNLFRQRHWQFAAKSASLKVIAVRVEGDKALAVLDLPEIPEVRQMAERRLGSRWRLLVLFDGSLE